LFPRGEDLIKDSEISIKDLLIFDAHCDTANVLFDDSSYFIKENKSQLTPEKIKKGGLKAQIFAIYVNPVYSPNRCIKKALLLYNALEQKLFSKGYGNKVVSTSEMKSSISKEKLACFLSLEGGHIIENSIDILEFFYSIGFRAMTLTHTKNTDWADSSGEEARWDGLNKLGRDIIEKMNKLGMIIDVSHVSDKTVEDVLEISSMPVMASHSSSRAICDLPRNISDDLIREISEKNGFIGVNFFPGFLKQEINLQVMANMDKYKEWFQEKIKVIDNPEIINSAEMNYYKKIVEGNDKVDLNSLIDHIIHISEVGGIDCVGLGSDFDGIPSTPTDLTDVSCYPALVNGLFDRGFGKNEIEKIMGLNLYNFFKNFDR
jgi:membrane dipeptidase